MVGKSLKHTGQEEWILAKGKWKIEKSVNEGEELKEGLFDSSKKKIINWLDQNATKNTDRDIYYDYELEGGEQVKIANGGIMVDIESGISKKLSFSEFKKYFINENELVNESAGLSGRQLEFKKWPAPKKMSDVSQYLRKIGRVTSPELATEIMDTFVNTWKYKAGVVLTLAQKWSKPSDVDMLRTASKSM